MAQTTKTLDGNFSLDDLKNTLVTQEQLGFLKLTGLSARQAPPPANVATFEDDSGNSPGELLLVQVGPGQDLNAITAQQKANGRTFLFSSTVFVSGNRTPIAVFR